MRSSADWARMCSGGKIRYTVILPEHNSFGSKLLLLVLSAIAGVTMSYELFHAASQCILCVPANASEFHSTYHFCWCAVILGLLVGGCR